MTSLYRSKQISSLTDAELVIAEEDVSNCILRAYAAPKDAKYVKYFESLQALSLAIQAEKDQRNNG